MLSFKVKVEDKWFISTISAVLFEVLQLIH